MSRRKFTHTPGDPIAIEVAALQAPDGAVRVLLQLPTGYVFIPPADARRLAALLLNAADEADRA